MSNKDLIEYVENILKKDKRFYQNRDYEFKNTVKRFYKSKVSASIQNNANPTLIMAPTNFNSNTNTIIDLPLIGKRKIEFINGSCYAKQISLDRKGMRFMRRIVTTIQELRVMFTSAKEGLILLLSSILEKDPTILSLETASNIFADHNSSNDACECPPILKA